MNTLTKEWLQQTIAELEEERDATPGAVNEDAANALAAMKLALASLEAEPAIHRWRRVTVEPYGPYPWHYGNFIGFSKPVEGIEDEYYYSAPPAPVSVPEPIKRNDADGWWVYKGRRVGGGCAEWYNRALDDCRAAMLQGVEPVSQRDELPLDYLQGHKEGLEWAARMAEANHPETGDWLYDDPLELAKAIRKGPDMPEAAGSYPAIPDGYALVPVEPTMAMLDEFDSIIDHGAEDSKDAWSRLLAAAAPQQEA
ncbi:hypothetical protein NW915_09635 [Enterobacter hormaechei subsp. hoffmannii]|uniref:hypothetical protein n=1 Tax=Enterobacter hormaechei TaxID=158836 RepID=UPI0007A84568|nr:hypothetical protein [Enterobacter hormaechei]MCW3887834.1 hypothetical protein [Enterobacter hormaechei subsp. hoffmannii]SAJ18657.1 Uncharacterised protein [Enterobacter hormaechei]VAK50984.1 Uncharacterised protein [Enterobacter hormaechei]